MRFIECKGAPRQGEKEKGGGSQQSDAAGLAARKLVVKTGKIFDLRRAIVEGALDPVLDKTLEEVYNTAVASGSELAPLLLVSGQLKVAYGRLLAHAKEAPYSARDVREADGSVADAGGWFDPDGNPKSGVVIRKSLFVTESLREGIGAFLHFYSHGVLKSKNEAVIEGMGSVLAVHTEGGRHLGNNKYPKETFISYNGPPLHLADSLVQAALDIRFPPKDGKRAWHFDYTEKSVASNAGRRSGGLKYWMKTGAAGGPSDVLDRHYSEQAKLSFVADGC